MHIKLWGTNLMCYVFLIIVKIYEKVSIIKVPFFKDGFVTQANVKKLHYLTLLLIFWNTLRSSWKSVIFLPDDAVTYRNSFSYFLNTFCPSSDANTLFSSLIYLGQYGSGLWMICKQNSQCLQQPIMRFFTWSCLEDLNSYGMGCHFRSGCHSSCALGGKSPASVRRALTFVLSQSVLCVTICSGM